MFKTCFSLCLLAPLCLSQPVTAAHDVSDPPEGQDECGMGHRHGNAQDREEWLARLSPAQRAKARIIIDDARPRVRELRSRIRKKMAELESLSYDQETSPATLPRLGRELQLLRDELRATLMEVDRRMLREVGVSLGPPISRGCRMDNGDTGAPPPDEPK
ncbi:periplasmic heavy metal sensor [Desulfovibrio sp. SGI.169]|uniref:periplasmic heavy metal sensor n=1 Tax=Desulfovibrio sp. SGI.169 TaxID=3420561 RepID=UPI003D06A31C